MLSGIEAHVAVIIASIPALNHFFRKTYKESTLGSRLKNITKRQQTTNNGYDRTGSRTNSEMNAEHKVAYEVPRKGSVHANVRTQLHLKDFLRELEAVENEPDTHHYKQPRAHQQRAWLDSDTSDDERIEFRAH